MICKRSIMPGKSRKQMCIRDSDTPLFERRIVVLGEHEGGLLAGLPCDVALVGFSFLVHQAGNLDRSPCLLYTSRCV